MERDERIELLEDEVRSLRAVAESTHRNTSWLLWLLVGIPAALILLSLAISLFDAYFTSAVLDFFE